MNWTVTADKFDIETFKGFAPDEVLYDFDGPRIFTVSNSLGELLFYLADEQDNTARYIVVPTSAKIVEQVKTGASSVREALDQPWVWIVDAQLDGTPVNAWKGVLNDIPADVLPQSGVMLYPHLEPVLSLRAIGDTLAKGKVTASVMRLVADGALTALRKVADKTFELARSQGRKANVIRQFYDLPITGFAYNSFEVSFRLPLPEQMDFDGDEALHADFMEMGKQLDTALKWATTVKPDQDDTTLDIELLEALEKLVPPQTGIVKELEIKGRLLGGGRSYKLTREVSKNVRRTLGKARVAQEKLTTVSGLVRECDRDNFSFILRETDDGKDHACAFPGEFLDDVLDVFYSEEEITVNGRENLKNGKIDVALVSRLVSGAAAE
jgi:hypothetical protein